MGWAYKTVWGALTDEELNEVGGEEWELVRCDFDPYGRACNFVFKRPYMRVVTTNYVTNTFVTPKVESIPNG